MGAYALRRILSTIPVLIGASIVIFLLIRLVPGDPAAVLAGNEATPQDLAAIRKNLGLTRPIYIQYFVYVDHALHGNLGQSYYYKEDIMQLVVTTMPATIELAIAALIVSLIVAIPAGVISAVRRNSWIDHTSMIAAVLGVSIPVFWLGIMFIFLFAVKLHWLPASGRGGPVWTVDGLKHLVLPAVSLGAVMMASTTRLTRGSMLEVLQEDYVRTARSKGLHERSVIYRHAFRNALIPVVTNVGLQVGGLLAGSFLTETVFAWPGIGRLSVNAMFQRDYPLIQGTMLMVVLLFIIVNLLVDLSYAVIDPRISYEQG
jgi:peptide/nickel transport system permease protein